MSDLILFGITVFLGLIIGCGIIGMSVILFMENNSSRINYIEDKIYDLEDEIFNIKRKD
jgi:hypothetical protein